MSLENKSAILLKGVLDTHKNWRTFLSELHIREDKLSFLNQTLHTKF